MEGTPPPRPHAAPLLPPQASPADAIRTPDDTQQDLAGGEVSAPEAPRSTSAAASTGFAKPTQLALATGKSSPPQADPDQKGADIHCQESLVSILQELTTSVGINAELQCTLCHEVLCKPVTSPCGHSFCRVCLIEYLLSKELAETQCPICRGLVLHASVDGGDGAAPVFSINVTLWNLIQLLVPAMREKDRTDEDADYALKYDQFDAKWRIAVLQRPDPRPSRRRHRFESDDEIESSEDEMDGDLSIGSDSEDGISDATQGRQLRYPELRQENSVDGHLEVFRNVVLDRDDANEDGYEGMRVSLAVMEFPSLFQPFNEHQECSVVVLKCEEDEDMDGGIPFFTSDDGEDDEFIISDYYNEIRLRVTDDTGNVVMERTRGATQGIASFPNLRLDVPSGMYDFQFKDDLYGIRLTIRTEVRDLRDEDDAELEAERPMSYVMDQAGERSRSRGRSRRGYDEEENNNDDSDADSNDSFIVDDDEELEHEGDNGARFSGDEQSEPDWSSPHEEDEEEAMERRERTMRGLRVMRHQHDEGGSSSNEGHQEGFGDSEAEADSVALGSGHVEESESDDEGHLSCVSSGRSAKRNRIVDDDSDGDGDRSEDVNGDQSSQPDPPGAQSSTFGEHAGRKRPRAIMESEDEDGNEEDGHPYRISNAGHNGTEGVQPSRGMLDLSSNKRIRNITSRLFQDDDDEFAEDVGTRYSSNNDEAEAEDQHSELHRSRWIGGDPYGPREGREIAESDVDDAQDGSERVTTHGYVDVQARPYDSDGHESSHSEMQDEENEWNAGYAIEHDAEDDFSE